MIKKDRGERELAEEEKGGVFLVLMEKDIEGGKKGWKGGGLFLSYL